VLPDDAVVARKHLAFHCSSFAESEVLSREGYVLSFVGTKTKLTQEEESAKNTVLKQRQYKGAAYKVGLPCHFHVADLIAGDALGLTDRDASSVLAVAEVDAEPNPAYAEAASRLAVSVAGLEASLPVAAPEPRRSPRNKLARTGGGGAAAGQGGAGAAAAAPMPAARQLKMITCWTCGFVFQERPPSEYDVDPSACGRGDVCKLPQPESAEEPAAE